MKIKVEIKLNKNLEKIIKIDENKFNVYLKEKPINNKANIKLIKLLKKYFSKEIIILQGQKSKNKIILVKKNEK